MPFGKATSSIPLQHWPICDKRTNCVEQKGLYRLNLSRTHGKEARVEAWDRSSHSAGQNASAQRQQYLAWKKKNGMRKSSNCTGNHCLAAEPTARKCKMLAASNANGGATTRSMDPPKIECYQESSPARTIAATMHCLLKEGSLPFSRTISSSVARAP